jgi:hypothetical protein
VVVDPLKEVNGVLESAEDVEMDEDVEMGDVVET